jgi:NitT/TauT family transport system ATP-binding protein
VAKFIGRSALEYGESLLIILPECANIGRAMACGFCHYLEMASAKPDIALVRESSAGISRGEEAALRSVLVNTVDVMSTEVAPKRLVVDARDISLTFETADGRVEALSNINLQIAEGEFVSFIGPSGCGKTTMLRVIADLQQPTSGSLLVNGMSAEQARLARSYGYVFQAPALFPWRTIEKNLKLPLEIMGYSEAEQQRRAGHYLSLVNLNGFERKFPWQLSGGMQQRVSIARALSFDPALLLMDEPFGALDEIVRDHLNEQLLKLWNSTEKTVLFVTHSIPEAVFLSTRIVVMSPRPGRIIDVIDCDFPLDRSLEIRESSEFLKIAQRVRKGLRAGHSYDE